MLPLSNRNLRNLSLDKKTLGDFLLTTTEIIEFVRDQILTNLPSKHRSLSCMAALITSF